jgi:hypothetical protein
MPAETFITQFCHVEDRCALQGLFIAGNFVFHVSIGIASAACLEVEDR